MTDRPNREPRTWRLWQVETSFACNLFCIMCPWIPERQHLEEGGHMSQAVWQALAPDLDRVASVDFSGGGEPLLQPCLLEWIRQARDRGCETGFLTNGTLLSREVSHSLVDAGLTWIGFSMDGADRSTYEAIRKGADFERVCQNIRYFTGLQENHEKPRTLLNFVMMNKNQHQLEDIVDLACDLGVDQVNFKQCDVIRGNHGKGLGLYASQETRGTAGLKKTLARARKRAGKRGIKTTAFAFAPEELPVCAQDPGSSLFIRYNGQVSPCISLAIGGPSTFLGQSVVFPRVSYGRLPEVTPAQLWEGETCRFYRDRFAHRILAHDRTLAAADISRNLFSLHQAFEKAIAAMPEAPAGCRTCHYLFDI